MYRLKTDIIQNGRKCTLSKKRKVHLDQRGSRQKYSNDYEDTIYELKVKNMKPNIFLKLLRLVSGSFS